MARALTAELSPRIERYLRRIDGSVVAAARIASLTALVTVMVALWSIQGDWDEFFNGQTLFVVPGEKHMLDMIAWDVTLAAAAIGVIAILIGLACARETSLRRRSRLLLALEHRTALAIGVILGVGSLAVGFRYDYDSYGFPRTLDLLPIFTATGGLAVLLVVAALTLRRRRRELAQLAPR